MSTAYVLPQLADVYATLGPVVEALLRVTIALCLIPHGLRTYFGMFPNTGMPINSLPMLVDVLDQGGYRPGWVWGPVIVVTELIGGHASARLVHAPGVDPGVHSAGTLGL
jgi:uncharacterized membrane protein YphA (DoxX/SURF4 family)